MLAKIKSRINNLPWKQFGDVRFLGLLVFAALALLVSWSGINVIQTNYNLEKQVSKIKQEIDVSELANENLKLKNQYYNTDDFLELAARRQFGKALPGETLVIVPQTVAYRYAPPLASSEKKSARPNDLQKAYYQRNFEAWVNFFLHRKQVE